MIQGSHGGMLAVKGAGLACAMTLDPNRFFEVFRYPPADEGLAQSVQDWAKAVR